MNIPTKSLRCKSIAFAFLAAVVLVPASHAQTHAIAKVQVPFGFESGSIHLAAGVYDISQVSGQVAVLRGDHDGMFFTLRSEDNAYGRTAERGKVVFLKYGDRYFLHEVWRGGSTSHLVLLQSKAEKQAQLAQAASAPAGGGMVTLVSLP